MARNLSWIDREELTALLEVVTPQKGEAAATRKPAGVPAPRTGVKGGPPMAYPPGPSLEPGGSRGVPRDAAQPAEVKAAHAETRAAEATARIKEAQTLAAEAEVRVREAETRAAEAEVRAAQAETRAAQADAKAKEAEAQMAEAEVRVKEADARMAEAEVTAKEAEARMAEAAVKTKEAEVKTAEAMAQTKDAEARTAEAMAAAKEAEAALSRAESGVPEPAAAPFRPSAGTDLSRRIEEYFDWVLGATPLRSAVVADSQGLVVAKREGSEDDAAVAIGIDQMLDRIRSYLVSAARRGEQGSPGSKDRELDGHIVFRHEGRLFITVWAPTEQGRLYGVLMGQELPASSMLELAARGFRIVFAP